MPAMTSAFDGDPPVVRLRRLANEWAHELAETALVYHLQVVWEDAVVAAGVLAAGVLAATSSRLPGAPAMPSNEYRQTSRDW